MKLAEALLIRADMQKQLTSLKSRIESNIQVQEGETPDETPTELMITAQQLNNDLHTLIGKIQRTNASVKLDNGRTMLDLLVERDMLLERHRIIMSALKEARELNQRYSLREIKWIVTVPVKDLQKQADDVSTKIRQVNTKIQSANWLIDLVN
ncbi:MAG: septicolysin [Gammaproteobacteria bacterium]|nr:MAG: septicolysin [Gammaproteobacteria bacterium]